MDAGPTSANKTLFGVAAPPPLPMPVRFGKPGDALAAKPVAKPAEVPRKTNPPLPAVKPAAAVPVSSGPAPASKPAPAMSPSAAIPAAPAPKPSEPAPPKPAFAKTLFMSGPPPSSVTRPSSPSVAAAPSSMARPSPPAVGASPSIARPSPPSLAAPAAPPATTSPAGATPLASSESAAPSEIPIVLDIPPPDPVADVPASPSVLPESQQPMLTMETPGKQSRTILLHDGPPMPAPAPAPASPEARAPQPELATVRFDLGDLTPVDAAPVALLMASRQPSDKHDQPASAAEAREAPAKLEAPKPRVESSSNRGGVALRRGPWLTRALADGESAMRLLIDAAKFYLQHVRVFALLMGLVLLPMVATKSCLVAASTGSVGTISTTMDLSQVREDLTRKAQISKAQGKVDKAALAELAALEAVAAAPASQPIAEEPSEFVRTARWVGTALLTGILMLGLALPLGTGAVTMLLIEQTAMGRWLSLFELLNRLWRRRLPLGASLLPAALIVAMGCSLFMVPGLLASALFLFVPAIVLFEHSTGKTALARSLALVRSDGVRVLVLMLAAFVAGAAAYALAGAVMPEGTRRIHVFLRLLLGDGLMVAFFPVLALAVARLYIDLRAREGETPETLVHAGRRETPAGLAHAGRR